MNLRQYTRATLRFLDRHLGIRSWLYYEPQALPKDGFDLNGEKELDWGWVAANIPPKRGRALDVGCVGSPVSPILISMNYEVVGVDLRADVPYTLDRFRLIQGDFNQVQLEPASFDVVVMCSSVEHIGLAGRYGNSDDLEGDIQAMGKVERVLKPDGVCILTIPVGLDGVHSPWHRVYGQARLPRLLHGFEVVRSRFFVKQPWGNWYEANDATALAYPSNATRYALGQFVLRLQATKVNV